MRIGLGILTLAAGVAACTVWFAPSTLESGLAVVSDVGAGGVASLSSTGANSGSRGLDIPPADTASSTRFFGTALPVTSPTSARQPSVESSQVSASSTVTANPWTTDVVIYSSAREQGLVPGMSAPARVLSTSSATSPKPMARQDIARALQAELKRVGCYLGEVDGEWGSASRRALRAFIEQVNSGISGDEPDQIQLTLIRGYSGNACRSAPDATGTMTANRTSPPALGPAMAPSRSPFASSTPTFVAAPVPAPSPISQVPVVTGTLDTPAAGTMRAASFDGRMAVGAPLPADPAAGDAAPVSAAPTPPPRVQRQRPAAQQSQRRERAWTGTFFNQ